MPESDDPVAAALRRAALSAERRTTPPDIRVIAARGRWRRRGRWLTAGAGPAALYGVAAPVAALSGGTAPVPPAVPADRPSGGAPASDGRLPDPTAEPTAPRTEGASRCPAPGRTPTGPPATTAPPMGTAPPGGPTLPPGPGHGVRSGSGPPPR
ncbi:hypothetical protein [Streptomyces sp. x-80]|uniref:hypothetical protein n=1 Tax=Streptomyces sp. x-80 TaxID=2789282 RepID=UPI003980F5D4